MGMGTRQGVQGFLWKVFWLFSQYYWLFKGISSCSKNKKTTNQTKPEKANTPSLPPPSLVRSAAEAQRGSCNATLGAFILSRGFLTTPPAEHLVKLLYPISIGNPDWRDGQGKTKWHFNIEPVMCHFFGLNLINFQNTNALVSHFLQCIEFFLSTLATNWFLQHVQ